MPSLMLRDLPAELVDAVRSYARANNIGLPAAAQQLLRLGLESDRVLQAAPWDQTIDELQAIVEATRKRPI